MILLISLINLIGFSKIDALPRPEIGLHVDQSIFRMGVFF